MLRESEARDRAAFIELFASPEVGAYIGGPRPRDELERTVPEVPRTRLGLFVVALDGAMIGMVTLDVRGRQRGFEFIETRTGRARIVLPGHFRRNTRLTARYTGNARYAPSHSSARP